MDTQDISPALVVLFELNGSRKGFVCSGYRPGHLIKENYITTGIHNYNNKILVEPDGKAIGTITFISPECYPHCLCEGDKIAIIDGTKTVGHAIILEVLNPILKGNE